ncbi:MAG: hypothetical protein GKR92_02300 [Gammaproteobacteria bacterium]|nr:MAG: hypothetical protein GKR92_02300 [Gammaproteobacteria bacterium]
MTENNVSDEIYKEFHQINRKLTYSTIGLVCITALLVWLNGIDFRGKHLSEMGLLFMLLGFFTYKIPYISYRFLLYKYKNVSEKRSAIGYDWKQFRDIAMLRKY